MIIRRFTDDDIPAINYIHFETGFFGKSMLKFLDSQKIWNKSIKHYFSDGIVFVVEDNNRIVGYLLGQEDSGNEILSFLKDTFFMLLKIPFLHRKDKKFWLSQIGFIFRAIFSEERKFKTPKHAAHLHINLLPEYRGRGFGSKLLNEFFETISYRTNLVYADSFDTKLNPNKNFWIKNGFKVYSKVKTTMWKNFVDEDINLVCYVKNI